MSRDVVITGLGAVTPLGVGAPTLIERWTAGESGIEDGLGRCRDFEPTDHISRREARRADRFTQLALVAAHEAIEDAGWSDDGPYADTEIGCVIGTGIGGIATIEDEHQILREQGAAAMSPLCVPQMMPNAAAGAVAMRHGLRGECYGTVSACAAGAQAVGAGMRMVERGDARACVVGGTEAGVTPLAVAAFDKMGATSKLGVSRPFDRRRDGFVIAEGAGVLILENAESAAERGATVLGRLTGYGATADAHHLTAPDPDGDGAARAVEAALRDAEIEPGEVAYVNAHGTSTPLNDRSETEAIKRVFGARADSIPVSSLKSSIGHLLGAAGAVEAVATVLALRDAVAPPTINHEQPDEGLDLDYVPGESRPIERNGRAPVGISNSFGFGGHNVVLCMEAPE
ncbi:MAG: 3-oxoacyl-(acyl-carrier-protein) synthase 2 [Solirubrobacterales bacterium]|nr:3-oxoacyl-(acyl-carrier-protein) synthase 2 [Solirubrobacterales bacterium]